MKRILFYSIAVIILSAANAFSQTKSVSQIPEVEPFKISRGTSFSASVPNSKENASFDSNNSSGARISGDFSEALAIIRDNYISGKRINYNELTKSAVTAMLRTLDPHSNYYDSNEYDALLTDQRSEYFGIGATIVNYQLNNQYDTFVISTFPESPAFRAGLRFGDKILTVDGENVRGATSAAVRDKVRGKKGTVARLTVERADSLKVETVEIRRSRVPQPSIPDAYLLNENIGYVDLTEGFNYTTLEELNVALSDLRDQGMKSLILDLRENPGGILEQAVRVAELFLPAGNTIVTQRGRFPIDNRVWKSTGKSTANYPLAVLVNEGSASASEIVAGALQDYDRALIIGENTFGKGLVQSVINLPYGSGLTLTTARYFTPSGRSIQRDYSNGNLYDYYNHKVKFSEKDKNANASRTVTGRKVFGGDGITPDEIVKTSKLNQNQILLLDFIFFFSREIAAGRVKGFENYKVGNQIQFGRRIRPNDFPISEDLFNAFKEFVLNRTNPKLLDEEKAFIKSRLRVNLATAAFGSVAANQIIVEEDLQVLKAVEIIPRAGILASTAKKSLQKSLR